MERKGKKQNWKRGKLSFAAVLMETKANLGVQKLRMPRRVVLNWDGELGLDTPIPARYQLSSAKRIPVGTDS